MEEPQQNIGGIEIDNYVIERRIAVGGMAEIFLAKHIESGGQVVIKQLLAGLPNAAWHRAHFQREAELLGCVRSDRLLRLAASGSAKIQATNPRPYIVTEFVDGCDLFELMRVQSLRKRNLPKRVALYLADQLLGALDEFHSLSPPSGPPFGVVHADVSPSNLMCSQTGEVKLIDFGIARVPGEPIPGDVEHTRGKLHYLSPELVNGTRLSQRSDIFSAAAVIAELLSGIRIFEAPGELETLIRIRDVDLNSLGTIAHTIEAEVFRVIKNALTADPADRYPTANEFRKELSEVADYRHEIAKQELATLVRDALIDIPTTLGDNRNEAAYITSDLSSYLYEVRRADGSKRQNIPLFELLEMLHVGDLSFEDLVREEGGEFRRVEETPMLERHLPAGGRSEKERSKCRTTETYFLDQTTLVGVLARFILSKQTGMLRCEKDGIHKEIYIESGVPRFVSTNVRSELLGAHLVREGTIEQQELEMALAVLPRFEGRLGDSLIALGLIEPLELFQTIAEQVRQRLSDVCLWRGGHATLYVGIEAPKSNFPLSLEPWPLLDRIVRDMNESGRFNEVLCAQAYRRARRPVSLDEQWVPLAIQNVLRTLENGPRNHDDAAFEDISQETLDWLALCGAIEGFGTRT